MRDIHRPGYHFTPPVSWMNDPNGLVYYDGEYHLFYQYHPASSSVGPMHWGHAVSRDLLHWQHLPIALYPDENGLIFSGSAVVDWFNTAGFGKEALVAVFTHHAHYFESQCLAYSTDKGRTWTKYSGNPVLTPPPDTLDFRDPKVFWHEAGYWVMLLAAGNTILFYTSSNLVDWRPSGSFGVGYDSTGSVWETPDLFQLPVDHSSEIRWVLTVGVSSGGPAGGSATQYFIGQFDGKIFTSENPRDTILWADFGADFYASQSWNDEPNGRRILLAWLSNWQYAALTPTSTWRGAFSLPRELALTAAAGGIRLVQQPIPELKTLRAAHYHWEDKITTPGVNLFAEIKDEMYEIVARFDPSPWVTSFGFKVRAGEGLFTTITCNLRQHTISIDRTHANQVDFHPQFNASHSASLEPIGGIINLHIYVDRSSVEVFAGGGLVTFSEIIFPSQQSQGLELFTTGGSLKIISLDVYLLTPSYFYGQ
jgi:fructan beta-fructosidase